VSSLNIVLHHPKKFFGSRMTERGTKELEEELKALCKKELENGDEHG